ncbi:hypothetical protein IQ273_23990 [Nodosilinea sp. LEGE 07298]|uniref:hypothetical protein n=1 Tax=Nodosilinea sp. LEGE 07298 TaxID=2777970 RepID=UPI001880791A|nr:hypothetical protein [Nodosilinea sp. LEGE 07298]MBE9112458.1 hypothetical protein [Nodosilinea sp. LEGE 07298]
MGLERRLSRDMFLNTEIVELRQMCFTPGRMFEPGKYIAGDLPDTAFEMGLVEKLPPVRGKSEELGDPPAKPEGAE